MILFERLILRVGLHFLQQTLERHYKAMVIKTNIKHVYG